MVANRVALTFCGVLALLAVLGAGCGAHSKSRASEVPGPPALRNARSSLAHEIRSIASVGPQAGTFVAQWIAGRHKTLQLERLSARDGLPLGRVATLPQYPRASVTGPYRASDGSLWLTATRGPRYRSNVAGGDPAPRSCGGVAVRLDPTTGATQQALSAPRSELISDVVPSPDGRSIAFESGGCATYLDSHLVIRDISDGKQFTIGTKAAPCHGLGPPSWSADSSTLLFLYAPAARGVKGLGGNSGLCPSPKLGKLAIVAADHPSQIRPGDLMSASHGCGYTYAAFDPEGIAAIESCGQGADRTGQGSGGAYLVQLDVARHVTARVALEPGANPATLSVDSQGGQILITEYQNPQYRASARPASDWIWAFDGKSLRLVRHYVNPSRGHPSNSTW